MLAIVLLLSFLVAILGLVAFLYWSDHRKLALRFADVIDADVERDRVVQEQRDLRVEVDEQRSRWKTEFAQTIEKFESLTAELDRVNDTVYMQSFGLYEPQFDYDTSEEYKTALEAIRERQKQMIRAKTAAVSGHSWEVDGSKRKGMQQINRILRLQLRAFNAESESVITKVRYNNVGAIEKRIDKACRMINRLGESIDCYVTDSYRELKIKELHLAHELKEKKQAEKEEQRAIREQMREDARAEKEIEKAIRDAEEDEARYNEALKKARREVAEAEGAAQEKLTAKILELERRLDEARGNAGRAKSRAQLTKSGHVYVVSNLGSFGKGIYKIGMTRRLEPLDRVRELGGPSVPFPFDVHAMIFAKDAPGFENLLHRRFADRRLNLVNRRKEFFSVTLEEIKEAVHETDATIHITMAAEAQQFVQSEGMRQSTLASEGPTREERIVSEAKQQLLTLQAKWDSVDPSTLDDQSM